MYIHVHVYIQSCVVITQHIPTNSVHGIHTCTCAYPFTCTSQEREGGEGEHTIVLEKRVYTHSYCNKSNSYDIQSLPSTLLAQHIASKEKGDREKESYSWDLLHTLYDHNSRLCSFHSHSNCLQLSAICMQF